MSSKTLKLSGGLQLGAQASAPNNPLAGLIYYDSGLSEFRWHNGSGFQQLADYGQLGATGASSGAARIGTGTSWTNITPSANNVEKVLEALDVALSAAGGTTFDEAMFQVYQTGTPANYVAFDLTALSAARSIIMPDSNVDLGKVGSAIQKDGSVTFTANQPMGGFKLTGLSAGSGAGDSVRYEQAILISGANAFAANQSLGGFKLTNVSDPSSAQDAATKAYVDATINGIKPKQAARVAADINIDIATELENGDTVDGIVLATGDRVLLTAQTLPEENGIYIVAASGAASRSSDFDSLTPIDEINGSYVPVQEGSYAAANFVQYGTVTVLGTDPINFTFVPAIVSIIGGDMITVAGNVISVDLATASGLESSNPGNNAGQLRVKLQASDPSLLIDGSNQLGVKLNAAGAITSGASGLIVGVDGSTLEINSNALRVKANGIGDAQLRQSAGLSVIGRSANSTGNVADITAGVDGQVLARSGTSIGFTLIADANIGSGAAISLSKLAALANNFALVSNGSGVISVSAVTSTELGYVAGVSSSIQTQLNSKLSAVVQDTAPQLGGTLDTNGQAISGIVRRGANATAAVQQEYLDSIALAGSQSGTVIASLTFNTQNIKSVKIDYSIFDSTTNNIATGVLLISADNASTVSATSIDVTDLRGNTGADVGVLFDASLSGANGQITFTSTSGSKTMRADVKRFRAV